MLCMKNLEAYCFHNVGGNHICCNNCKTIILFNLLDILGLYR